jgi:hypothetical protein
MSTVADWQALCFGAAVGGASFGFALAKQRRRLRRDLGDLYPRWRALPAGRRLDIRRAVRRGRPVRDPRDAVFAAFFASRLVESLSSRRKGWLYRTHLVLHLGIGGVALAAFLVILATRGWTAWDLLQILFVLYVFASLGFLRLWRDRMLRRAHRAREANSPSAQEYEARGG